MKEYIPSLNVRKNWNKVQQNVKVNDTILQCDSNTPRSFLPLATVIKVHPSKDELVGYVTLKLLIITLIRPVNKLCLLEESTWIRSNEFSLIGEECCIYWHCKRRQNRNVTLSVVSLNVVICVPFSGIYLHFSRVFVSRLWGVAAKVMSCSQKKPRHFY